MYVGTALLLAGCVAINTPPDPSAVFGENEQVMTVSFLDVGQADCTLISLPDGKHILIDGGNVNDGELIADYLKRQGIKKLDLMVATHPHEDHIGGLDDVLAATEVMKVYMPEISEKDMPTTKTYEYFIDAVLNEGCAVSPAKAGETVLKGEDYTLTCLSPAKTDIGDMNNYSVVLMLSFKDADFLFTGDAEKDIENEILKSGYNIDAEVIKVPHHGSDTSSSKKYLSAVTPYYAVISCGKDNSYGHPHAEVLERYNAVSATVYRTDLQGTVIIATNGTEFNIINDTNLSLDGSKK